MAKNKPLTIGLVIDTSLDPTDGVQQYVLSVGKWLSSRGHEVHYLAGQTDKRHLANLHSLSRNITVKFNGNSLSMPLPTSRRRLQKFIKEINFDVLHVQTPHHPLMSQHLIRAASPTTAVVGTFHILPYGPVARLGTRILGIWLRPSLKRFDKMLAVSPAAAAFEEWSYGIKADVLPNVINYDLFHRAKPFDKYKDGTVNILFLGRLVPRKGCMVLLQALNILKDDSSLPKFRLIICGRGPLEVNLRKYVDQNGLQDIVEFTGFVSEEDKLRYYASADLAVFPSNGGESFGIVLLEAMAAGKAAVLAGDNPGYRSVMEPQPDLLFDPNDPNELAAKLAKYIRDKKLRRDMTVWAEDYSRGFATEAVGAKLLNIYEEALRKRRGL